MSSIVYLKGDLFTTEEKIIAHGCNTLGIMGAGVARLVALKSPTVFKEYAEHCALMNSCKQEMLGSVHAAWAPEMNKFIANLMIQNRFSTGPRDRACSYDAIDASVRGLTTFIKAQGETSAAMPMIGAGLAAGSWSVIEAIIDDNFSKANLICNVWQL